MKSQTPRLILFQSLSKKTEFSTVFFRELQKYFMQILFVPKWLYSKPQGVHQKQDFRKLC